MWSIETVPEKSQTLDLIDKDFKPAMFGEIKKKMSKKQKETMRRMSHPMENINK